LLGHLKAVFFVRDFEGDAGHIDCQTADGNGRGRKIAVTFMDDEVIVGKTLNYRPAGGGFFIEPIDKKSNNQRVFVVSAAVRHVRFP
jgi:hypothetical protein